MYLHDGMICWSQRLFYDGRHGRWISCLAPRPRMWWDGLVACSLAGLISKIDGLDANQSCLKCFTPFTCMFEMFIRRFWVAGRWLVRH
jgi:hypothetical protein